MSIKVMTIVWDKFNRGGSEKLAMLALADWCNDEGGSLHPSIMTIAKKINLSESAARRIIHKFIDEGYLIVTANHNGGDKGKTRHYKLNIKLLLTPSVDATPCVNATPSVDAPLPLASVHITPSVDATLTTNEPSIEPPIKNNVKKLTFVLPEWVNQNHWDAWHLHPKRKKLSDEQKKIALEQLDEWRQAGLDYAQALKNTAINGYQGIFLPEKQNDRRQTLRDKPSRMDISGIDYKHGVNADGSF